MAYKKQKNLVGNRDQYNKYYGDFRGVDFTSDHTRVHDQRFSYAVNMYKDYQSAQGHAIETIPGFRTLHSFEPQTIMEIVDGKKVTRKVNATIYGIHRFKYRDGDGNIVQSIIVHHGSSLSLLSKNDKGEHTYEEISLPSGVTMNARKSTSFVFNNRLYILDGKNFLYYDGTEVKKVADDAYIPTTYTNIIVGGENADGGTEYEQRNLLSEYYYETFEIGGYETEKDDSGQRLYYYVDVNLGGALIEVTEGTYEFGSISSKLNIDETQSFDSIISALDSTLYQLYVDDDGKKIWQASVRVCFTYEPLKHGIIKLKLRRKILQVSGLVENISKTESSNSIIEGCTIAAVYDNRVFLSGNPSYPRHVFYCGINSQTGFVDPSYWGILNCFQEGIGMSPVTALLPVADSLLVLKEDTQQDGSVYYHTRQETGEGVLPVIYPSSPGHNGTGCLGAAVNFLDDPVFISKYGLEGIGQLSVRYERAIEHRSYLIDSVLLNMGQDKLKNACLEEWNGYLLLLVDGKIFMADSRQRYTHESGVMQYEWYYLEDIGVYEEQVNKYVYASQRELDLLPEILKEYIDILPDASGEIVDSSYAVKKAKDDYSFLPLPLTFEVYYITKDSKNYLVSRTEEKVGGNFSPAVVIREIDGNIYFGTESGALCCFNFDKRSTDTFEIPTEYYTFNGRTIKSGCATKMDCCGIPHLTKSTVNRSTVIKTKALNRTAAKVAVRTNKNPFNQIARINAGRLDFNDISFADFTFEQTLFALKENEKQWVEKQYYIYSDEFQSPFALYYISYRYMIAGRIKE